jgi:hypothetical protein
MSRLVGGACEPGQDVPVPIAAEHRLFVPGSVFMLSDLTPGDRHASRRGTSFRHSLHAPQARSVAQVRLR